MIFPRRRFQTAGRKKKHAIIFIAQQRQHSSSSIILVPVARWCLSYCPISAVSYHLAIYHELRNHTYAPVFVRDLARSTCAAAVSPDEKS